MAPVLERKLGERGIAYELQVTEAPGHAIELAAAAARSGVETVLSVGGDGTIHEVANGFLSVEGVEPPALAVIPLGTGNDFYKMIGLPKAPDAALDNLATGVPKRFDVGRVTFEGESRYFVNLLGVGIDVEVLRRRERVRRFGGLTQYLIALLGAMVGFRATAVRLSLDSGEILEDPTMLAAITIGPSAGGGFLLCPGATPDDGLLDLCFFRDLNYLQILRYIPKVIRGTHGEGPLVELRQFEAASLETIGDEPLHFQIDGELVRTPTRRLSVEIVPASLRVIVPVEADSAVESGGGRRPRGSA